MRIFNSIHSLRGAIKILKSRKKRIGFVPTMGALHRGHGSLFLRSRRENDITVVSIFVNPKQFGPREDFDAYPRPEKSDILLAKKEMVDIIFYPSENEMYRTGFLTSVQVDTISQILCGKSRPGHFRGVTTVVNKLLNIVAPDVLYLGQKDTQQAVLIKRMIADLNIPVTVRICPIVRERDGLALSSRNCYLSARQRLEAPILYRALQNAKQKALEGEHRSLHLGRFIRSTIARQSSGKIDYIACVDADTLAPLRRLRGKIMIALAVKFGKTRLIDNIVFSL